MFFYPMGEFRIFSVLFQVVFAVVLVVIFVTIFRSLSQWHKNNRAPILSVRSAVVSRRMDVRRNSGNAANGMHTHYTSTIYYVTFQVESGDRIELRVPGTEYGLIAEGDIGTLTFQGTRYHGFQRERAV